MTKTHLEQLQAFPHYENSVLGTHRMTLPDWEDAGMPYDWELQQSYKGYQVYYDCGYGHLALFYKDLLISTGKDMITGLEVNNTHVIVVNAFTYNDRKHWLWFPAGVTE